MRKTIYLLFLLSSWICYGYAADFKFGGEEEQDPNNPKYQKMAEEVVHSHLHVKEQDIKKITVNKVTTQVVAGTVTRMQFRVFLVNGESSMCNSEIWEKPWENVKHVSYNCDSLFGKKKLSSIDNSRPEQLRDPNNPKYHKLAMLAIDSYLNTPGSKPFKKEDVTSVSVIEAKVKINSQIGNSLVLEVKTDNTGHFKCTGIVLESPWESTNTAKVTDMDCYKYQGEKADAKIALLQGQSEKNQKIGGQVSQDPEDPKYKQLAKESFEKYRKAHLGPRFKVIKFQMTKVATQMVSGVVTTLDFNVITDLSYKYQCHSQVLEQPWRHVKDITVQCHPLNKLKLSLSASRPKLKDNSDERNTVKVGGKEEQDPKDPKYNQLAEESFRKYRDDHVGPLFSVKELRVTRVTTQVVSGIIYAIDFKVFTDTSYTYDCHSDILDQPWLKNKAITVNCIQQKDLDLSTHFPIAGGEMEQDPNNPNYKKLAEESFQKYLDDHIRYRFILKELLMTKVTTQVVSGVITRLDFKAIPTEGNLMQCHSEILEQPWLQNKDITVICFSPADETKALLSNKKKLGQGLQDIAIDRYFKKVDTTGRWRVEQKYLSSSKTIKTRFGRKTLLYDKVDVLVSTVSGDYYIFNCSVVFGPSIPVPIGINCLKQTRLKGRAEWVDPTEEHLLSFAMKALQKYSDQPKNYLGVRGKYDVIVTFAVKGLVAGWRYEIDFIVRSLEVHDLPDLKCHAIIFQDLDGKQHVDKVYCNERTDKYK